MSGSATPFSTTAPASRWCSCGAVPKPDWRSAVRRLPRTDGRERSRPPAEFIGPSYTATAEKLQVNLIFDRAAYRKGEVVWAEVSVYNGGAEAAPIVYGSGCMQLADLQMDAPPGFFNTHVAAGRGLLGQQTACTMNIVSSELRAGDTLRAWYAWDTSMAAPGAHKVEAVFFSLPAPTPRITGEVLLLPSR